ASVWQKTARPCGVDDEPGRDPDGTALARTLERRAIALQSNAIEACGVEIDRALGCGRANQGVIEVGTIPVRIRDVIVRACRNQQLPAVPVIVFERLVETMKVKREAAFQ